ncbi:MAG TPA: hypothetical protein VFV90_07635 [Usitatibacter sp.]|nr:hypothetical protein [Usitatibacter sp.]
MNTPQLTLPGVGFAEQAIARMRSLFKPEQIRDQEKLSAGHFLWTCAFDERDRRFALRLAKLDPRLHVRDWRELTGTEQALITSSMQSLAKWIWKHDRAIARLREERDRA